MDGEMAAQIRALEEKLSSPAVRSSEQELSVLLGDDFCEFGSSGRTFDKKEIVDALVREESPTDCVLEDFSARRVSTEVVLATYRSICAAGQRTALRSSLWVFRPGRWQLVFHQGTRIAHHAAP